MSVTVPDSVVVYAVRYCLSRRSYAADDGASLVIEHGPNLPDNLRRVLIEDIVLHLREDAHPHRAAGPMPVDIRARWQQALDSLTESAS